MRAARRAKSTAGVTRRTFFPSWREGFRHLYFRKPPRVAQRKPRRSAPEALLRVAIRIGNAAKREGFVKQAEETTFVDLIACEKDCRNCSYAAALDCDGNCGVCPHNGYCPCVNPVVVRSKSALRLIELRPILLQDLRVQKN
jgi:hypothetical protein